MILAYRLDRSTGAAGKRGDLGVIGPVSSLNPWRWCVAQHGQASGVGAWIGRTIGAAFLVIGGLHLYFGGMKTIPVVVGLVMIWAGVGLFGLRDSARKAGIAIAVLHVVAFTYALWLMVSKNKPAVWVVYAAAGILVSVAVVALLLLPKTRSVFALNAAGAAETTDSNDDDEPLLTKRG